MGSLTKINYYVLNYYIIDVIIIINNHHNGLSYYVCHGRFYKVLATCKFTPGTIKRYSIVFIMINPGKSILPNDEKFCKKSISYVYLLL